MYLTFTVTVRVEPMPGESLIEAHRDDDVYKAEFAAQMLAERLAVTDPRPFAENVYNRLAISATRIEMGGIVTHEQPLAPLQRQAEVALTLGFTSEQIAAARVDAPPAGVVD